MLVDRALCLRVVLLRRDDVGHAQVLDFVVANHVQDVAQAKRVRAVALAASLRLDYQVRQELLRVSFQ